MRTEIICAALAAFEEYGIKFSLDVIAKSLKISKKTIYQYFESKEELVSCAIDYIFADIHMQNAKIQKSDFPPLERLRQILGTYPTVINHDADKMNKIIELNPEIYAQIVRQFESHWDMTLDVYEECVQAGDVRPIRPECFRTVMLGVFDSVTRRGGGKEIMEECIDAVLYGFAEYRSGEIRQTGL